MKNAFKMTFALALIVSIIVPFGAFNVSIANAEDSVPADSVSVTDSAPASEATVSNVAPSTDPALVVDLATDPVNTIGGNGGGTSGAPTSTPAVIHVTKFLGDSQATTASAHSFAFAMTASYDGVVSTAASAIALTTENFNLDSVNAYTKSFTNPIKGSVGFNSFTSSEVVDGTNIMAIGTVCNSDVCLGDIDGNGVVDQHDLNVVLATWSDHVPNPNLGVYPDVDQNSVVNVDDLLMVINNYGVTGSTPADTNRDGVVDQLDIKIVKGFWGAAPANPANLNGDINHDGKVNVDDLLIVINHWGVCAAKYQLVGYSTGATLADAIAATKTDTAPTLTNVTSDQNVIVWNKICPIEPPVVTPPTDTPPAGGNGGGNGGGNQGFVGNGSGFIGGGSSGGGSSNLGPGGVGGDGSVLGASTGMPSMPSAGFGGNATFTLSLIASSIIALFGSIFAIRKGLMVVSK